jgi:hypothetical protein
MKKILFIAGISHSGTSLLDKLLDLHYEISSIVDYSKDQVDLIENDLTIFSSQKKLDDYIIKFPLEKNQYLLMKNPNNLDFLEKILSIKSYNCKVIIIYRDIRDVALSLFYRNDSMWPDYESAIKYCIEKYKIIENCNSNILKVNYSDLIDNFDIVINNIYNYLEISNNIDILKKFESDIDEKKIPEDKDHINRRKIQLKKKLYNSSRFKNETTEAQKIIYNKYVKNIESLKDTLFVL